MTWLDTSETGKQKYIVLRLYPPEKEKILLDFNPLKLSHAPHWKPMWEEWHCYQTPLRIYKADYEHLLDYINKVYPIKNAFDGTLELNFDVCSDNWIGKDVWDKIISEIEHDIQYFSDTEKTFFFDFLKWLKEALKYTDIIVVEGNL